MRVEEPIKIDAKDSDQTEKEKGPPKEVLTPREELIQDMTKAGYTVIKAIEMIEYMEGKKAPEGEIYPRACKKRKKTL